MSVELYGSYHDAYAEMYHHGVKGMKWGVRRKRATDLARRSASTAKKSLSTQDGRKDLARQTKGQAKLAVKSHGLEASRNRANARINRYGGSKGKAVAATVLRGAGEVTLAQLAAVGGASSAIKVGMKGSRGAGGALMLGSKAVAALGTASALERAVVDIYSISRAKR